MTGKRVQLNRQFQFAVLSTSIGSSLKRKVRQVRAVANNWLGPSGSNVDFLIALSDGLLNILWVESFSFTRVIRPSCLIMKHTIASP